MLPILIGNELPTLLSRHGAMLGNMVTWDEPLGDELDWSVDVVLRALGHDAVEEAVVAEVATHVTTTDRRAPRGTYSYDMAPPDGSIGVSVWVRADSIGEAVDVAVVLVSDAATAVTGERHPLWDVRIVPGPAVFGRAPLEADDPSRWARPRRFGWFGRR